MNREFLKGLGLDDAAIDKVMAEHGKTVESHKLKTSGLETSVSDLQGQLTQRDTDLNDLKKKQRAAKNFKRNSPLFKRHTTRRRLVLKLS